MGAGPPEVPMLQAVPETQPEMPGQAKAAGLIQECAFWLLGTALTPETRSGNWSRPSMVPEPVPEGSPPLKNGVTKAPLCSRKMLERRQPPRMAFTGVLQLRPK